MRGRLSELVADEVVSPCSRERHWVFVAYNSLQDIRPLLGSRDYSVIGEFFYRIDTALGSESVDCIPQAFLQRLPARNDDSYTDRALSVQALEIFQISVVERVLVVPLDFHRDNACVYVTLYVVNFMRG